MADILVVTSKVKAVVKVGDLRTGADYIEAVSARVEALTKQAMKNAVAAGRKTVMAEDLPKDNTLTLVASAPAA